MGFRLAQFFNNSLPRDDAHSLTSGGYTLRCVYRLENLSGVSAAFVPQLLGFSCVNSCIHGDGSVLRHFLYVSDVADAFDLILHDGSPGSTYNIGSDFEISVARLAECLVKKVIIN